MSNTTHDGFIKRTINLNTVPHLPGNTTGEVSCMAQGDGVVYMDYSEYINGSLGITYRGHQYRGSSHLVKGDAGWDVMGRPSFYREDHKDPSDVAKKALTAILIQIVIEFQVLYGDDMKAATVQRVRNDIARLDGQRVEKLRELGKIEHEIATLKASLTE